MYKKNLISGKLLLTFFLTLLFNISFANNIVVSNISLLNKNGIDKTVYLKFDVRWENSWRIDTEAKNWDAAWIFIKFRVGNGVWQHASLSTVASDYIYPDNAEINVPDDGKGFFIYRADVGSGNFSVEGLQLKWLYGLDGVENDEGDIEIRVFGIEMVYVPEGSFYVGDGLALGSLWDAGKTFDDPAYISTDPVIVRSDTSVTNSDYRDDEQIMKYGILVDGDDGIDINGITAVDNPDYPTGYKAFYCMRYEITVRQYVDYLNTLTRKQQNSHVIPDIMDMNDTNHFALIIPGDIHPARNSVAYDTPHKNTTDPVYFYCDLNNNKTPNEQDDGQDIACGNIDWFDAAAYADWAGLRPMTELEFEKACRGPEIPVSEDYAWNNNKIFLEEYTLLNAGTENEYLQNPASGIYGNCSYNLTTGHDTELDSPLRVGIFATDTSDRINSGASYYGIMELTGNIQERGVSFGIIEGRTFKGTNGDGMLTEEGNATNLDWPGIVPGEEDKGVQVTLGSFNRGGDWNDGRYVIHISSRLWASYDPYGRNIGAGFRAVRSAD